jgi:hypothetical protein
VEFKLYSVTVTNGVRQGGVLSLFLFGVYFEDLLCALSVSGIGCYWRWLFLRSFVFVDDIAVLAPCASALRKCYKYAAPMHCLLFNTDKTQLMFSEVCK